MAIAGDYFVAAGGYAPCPQGAYIDDAVLTSATETKRASGKVNTYGVFLTVPQNQVEWATDASFVWKFSGTVLFVGPDPATIPNGVMKVQNVFHMPRPSEQDPPPALVVENEPPMLNGLLAVEFRIDASNVKRLRFL